MLARATSRIALAVVLLALHTARAAAQPLPFEEGWTRLADSTVIRSAERIHRVAVRDRTPVDLLYVSVRGSGLTFENAEIRRADGTTETIEIRRYLGSGGRVGVYLTLCGGASPITRVLLRHRPGDPRYSTNVAVLGRARAPSTSALELPCETHLEALPGAEPILGYAWGATLEAARARCVADGGTAGPWGAGLSCAPFPPLDAVEARFSFDVGGDRPGLRAIEVVRSVHATATELRDALRSEVRAHMARLGRPRIDPFPVHCDVVFFDAPAPCFSTSAMTYSVSYEWGDGPDPAFEVSTEWMTERSVHELRLVHRRP